MWGLALKIIKGLFATKAGLIGIGLAAALVGGAWLYHSGKVAKLELAQERAETRAHLAEADLARSEKYAAGLKEERDAAEASTKRLQATLAAIDTRHRPARQRINTAPASADGPLAPVLRDTLRALRRE